VGEPFSAGGHYRNVIRRQNLRGFQREVACAALYGLSFAMHRVQEILVNVIVRGGNGSVLSMYERAVQVKDWDHHEGALRPHEQGHP